MRIEMFPCPHCAAEFDTFKSLEYHLRAKHGDAPERDSYRCVTCDADFMAEAQWLEHVRERHSP